MKKYYKISIAKFAARFRGEVRELKEVKPTTIPCLSPDEMRCENCGHGVPDEIDWDHYTLTGKIFCINCVA